jgi:hypothetical protein
LEEETARRLSRHDFSTEEREERRMSGREFPSLGEIRVLTNPKPEPLRGCAVTGPIKLEFLTIKDLWMLPFYCGEALPL